MDEIIYILLAVAWIAFSIFSANKKKKARQMAPPAEATTPPEVPRRSILEDILMGDEPSPETIEQEERGREREREVVIERSPIIPETKVRPIPQPVHEFIEGMRFKQLARQHSARQPSTFKSMQTQASGTQNLISDIRPIDLRRAVIYSIILERSYS
ncbi:MAG TPA: hypothetical protein VLH16_04060 [Bacteroidales bacterium]|nr:hypothetical protein [Bacteroidales bacterium]